MRFVVQVFNYLQVLLVQSLAVTARGVIMFSHSKVRKCQELHFPQECHIDVVNHYIAYCQFYNQTPARDFTFVIYSGLGPVVNKNFSIRCTWRAC